MPSILIVGATSDIAKAAATIFGKNGWDLVLAARDAERLQTVAMDLEVRLNKKVPFHQYDVLDGAKRLKLWDSLPQKPSAVLMAVGLLGDQTLATRDPDYADMITDVNYKALIPIITQASQYYEEMGSGAIIGISSVAGERGRASNYVYGAAKAAFTAYLSGLRNRLFKKGVKVLTVKPGYVKTSMTAGLKIPKSLTATPEEVARDIYEALRKNKSVVYSKWYWRFIMWFVRALPECIFKRSKT
jgi:short-subunit dehydrogenase